MPNVADEQAIALCQRGDEAGFRCLFDAYRNYVYSLCLRIVADREEALDACQEVFLAVFGGIKSVREGSPLKPWLRKVAVNVCLNYVASSRSGRHDVLTANEFLNDALAERFVASAQGSAAVDPEKAAEDSEMKEALASALSEVHPDLRLAVVLFHQEGLSYDEIAGLTGWPLGTVKTNLYRGRKQMGRILRLSLGAGGADQS